MAQNTQRVLDALRDRLDTLNQTTTDYANWDDTYNWIEDGNAAYIESNLGTGTFTTNDLNLMLFVDNSGYGCLWESGRFAEPTGSLNSPGAD